MAINKVDFVIFLQFVQFLSVKNNKQNCIVVDVYVCIGRA